MTNNLIALRAEYEALRGYKVFDPLADMDQKETERYIANLNIWLADLKADIREARATILILRTEYVAIKGGNAFGLLGDMTLEAANEHIIRLRGWIADFKVKLIEAKATILALRAEYEALRGPIAFTFIPVDSMSLEAANSHIARLRSMIAGLVAPGPIL